MHTAMDFKQKGSKTMKYTTRLDRAILQTYTFAVIIALVALFVMWRTSVRYADERALTYPYVAGMCACYIDEARNDAVIADRKYHMGYAYAAERIAELRTNGVPMHIGTYIDLVSKDRRGRRDILEIAKSYRDDE